MGWTSRVTPPTSATNNERRLPVPLAAFLSALGILNGVAEPACPLIDRLATRTLVVRCDSAGRCARRNNGMRFALRRRRMSDDTRAIAIGYARGAMGGLLVGVPA